VVICLKQGADLHMAQLMPLPLTVSCFIKIQIGFIFLLPAHLGSPGKRAVKRVCVCVLCVDITIVLVNCSVNVQQICMWSICQVTSTIFLFHYRIVYLLVLTWPGRPGKQAVCLSLALLQEIFAVLKLH